MKGLRRNIFLFLHPSAPHLFFVHFSFLNDRLLPTSHKSTIYNFFLIVLLLLFLQLGNRQVQKVWERCYRALWSPNQPEILKVEPEEEVDSDEKGPCILWSKVEKAIKEEGYDSCRKWWCPDGVLKLLGDGLRIMTQLISNIWNWRGAQRLYQSYDSCLKEEAKSYKMQQPSHSQPCCT